MTVRGGRNLSPRSNLVKRTLAALCIGAALVVAVGFGLVLITWISVVLLRPF
jgi:hypothetical protein